MIDKIQQNSIPLGYCCKKTTVREVRVLARHIKERLTYLNDILNNKLGLYEKALPKKLTWEERLSAAKRSGYDFVEMSIDETDERLCRLKWGNQEKARLKETMFKLEMPILTMCLSGNRRYPIGSENVEIREQGIKLIKDAISFALDIGIRIIQLAGYDEYKRPCNDNTRKNFLNSLVECVGYAENKAVMLAFETMENDLLDSVQKAMSYVNEVNSPWLNVYPDIGNLTAASQDIEKDYMTGKNNIVAIHLKDTKLGIVRDIGYGDGIVDFVEFFKLLRKVSYNGLFVAEMWTDETDASINIAKEANKFLKDKMKLSEKKDK